MQEYLIMNFRSFKEKQVAYLFHKQSIKNQEQILLNNNYRYSQMFRSPFANAFQSITNSAQNTFEVHQLQPIRQDFTIDINTSKQLQKNYFTQFRSLAEQNIFGLEQPSLEGFQPPKSKANESKIEAISRIKQPVKNFNSKINSKQSEYQKLMVSPSYYSFSENNQAMKENLQQINRDLSYNLRYYFKGGIIRSDHEEPLNLKNLNFETYSKTIGQQYSNHLFQSILETYGGLEVDQEVVIPDRYQVREKKPHMTVGTEVENQYISRYEDNSKLTKIALMKMEIRKCKFKEERNPEYFSQMEERLVIFFNYIIEDDPKLRTMSTLEKIRLVLSDLNRFKNQYCEGESKVSLLLFFFKEFQTLKEEKQKIEKQKDAVKSQQQQLTRRQYSVTPTKQKPKKPLPAKTESKIKIEDEDYWMGSRGNQTDYLN